MSHRSYRDESRKNWGMSGDAPFDADQLKTGALLRIADATEVMAKSYTALVAERDRLQRYYDAECQRTSRLERQNRALRGANTKLRKALKAAA